jgi:CRP/FNR family transcriptional regulator, nitrogen fixation regulation protein
MYLQPTTLRSNPRLDGHPVAEIARSGGLDALIVLDRIGTRLRFQRNQEIYAEGDNAGAWYKVVSGTVRVGKLLADGRRHIAEFCFAGDTFGFEDGAEREMSAEAVGDVVLMRYPRGATERAIDDNPALARWLRDVTLKSLAAAQRQMLLLGRMTAHERVASFLLELAESAGAATVELPMSRADIADHLGLTIETVCRVLSDMKRRGLVAIHAHAVEILDQEGLEAIAED